MNAIFGLLTAALVAILCVVVWVAATSPTCAERGGKETFTHFMHLYNGKTTQLMPMFECIGAKP
jgi:hypothetical protein